MAEHVCTSQFHKSPGQQAACYDALSNRDKIYVAHILELKKNRSDCATYFAKGRVNLQIMQGHLKQKNLIYFKDKLQGK